MRDDTKNGCVTDYLRSEYLAIHTVLTCGTEPFRCVMLHFQDRRGAAQLHSVTEIPRKSPFLCVNKALSGMVFVPVQELSDELA